MTRPVDILALVCSPGGRRTRDCAAHVLEGAAAAGATTNLVEIPDGRLDVDALGRIDDADGFVVAAPTYRGQAAWPLKAVLDQIPRERDGTSPLMGKAAVILLTAASAHHALAAEPTRTILTDFFATQVVSPSLYFHGDDFDGSGRLSEQGRATATAAAAALTSMAGWARRDAAVRGLRPVV